MELTALNIIALSLATFYAAYVVARTAGPADVFVRVRGLRGIGAAASCFYCAALYAGVLAYALLIVFPPALYVLAGAGAAAFLYRWTGADHT